MHLRMISARSAKPIRAEEFGSSNPIVVFRSPYRYQLLSGSPFIGVTAQARKAVSDQCSTVVGDANFRSWLQAEVRTMLLARPVYP